MADTPDPPRSLADLRALTDDEIVALHDREFLTTTKGTALYAGELNRRASDRAAAEVIRLANESNRLAMIAIGIAVLAVIVAVAAVALR